jgi:hypothetical protein
MSEQITYSFKVQVKNGPSITVTDALDLDAYDKIEATIPKGGTATDIEVQPGSGAEFLLVTATSYEKITYKVDSVAKVIKLDGPHILIGEGAVSLLGNTQKKLTFTNASTTADNAVCILVGRSA